MSRVIHFFITACLEGSLSASGLSGIRTYREEIESRPRPEKMTPLSWEHHKRKLLFAFVDNLLDGHSPVTHLEDEQQATIVQKRLPSLCERAVSFAGICCDAQPSPLAFSAGRRLVHRRGQEGECNWCKAEDPSRDYLTQYSKLYGSNV